MKPVKTEYDAETDCAYLYLKYPIKDGEAVATLEINEDITLDFDKNGKLLGIEILHARKHLSEKELLVS